MLVMGYFRPWGNLVGLHGSRVVVRKRHLTRVCVYREVMENLR